MFLHINQVQYLGDYRLKLWFDNGKIKEINLEDELYGNIFAPLKDFQFFQKVYVNEETQTIEWPNGADFAPEFLFDKGEEIQIA